MKNKPELKICNEILKRWKVLANMKCQIHDIEVAAYRVDYDELYFQLKELEASVNELLEVIQN